MNSECHRIADQLSRAFAGEAWHGPSLQELLANVTAEQARIRAMGLAHSVWELVLHIEVWVQAAAGAVQGVPMPRIVGSEKDWPQVTDTGETAWASALRSMFESATQLTGAIDQFEDARLGETVPGRQYDFYYLFHGITQHSLYHAGQIALLKKVVGSSNKA
jgi:hypothetical protein